MSTTLIPVSDTLADLRMRIRAWRSEGWRIGLVPTMGALHEGHISLVRTALETCERVVASIFINPTQFAPNEDFSTYPRTFDDDVAKLAAADCHLVWAPTVKEMYPDGFATRVVPAGAAEAWRRISGRTSSAASRPSARSSSSRSRRMLRYSARRISSSSR